MASPVGRDVQAFFPLTDLFAGMEHATAETLCEAWRIVTAERKAGHQPYLAENADRRRGTMGTPARTEQAPNARIGRSAPDGARRQIVSRKARPARSSTPTTQTSGSKPTSRVDALVDFGQRRILRDALEETVARMGFAEARLRRRRIEVGGAGQTVDDDEDGAGLLGAAADDRGKGAFDEAAAHIGPDPQGRGDAHRTACRSVRDFMAPMPTSRCDDRLVQSRR